MKQPDDPFHIVGHRVDGQPDKTRFSVMVNNRPLFKQKIPMSRREALIVCKELNGSRRCRKWAAGLPLKGGGVV